MELIGYQQPNFLKFSSERVKNTSGNFFPFTMGTGTGDEAETQEEDEEDDDFGEANWEEQKHRAM